MLIFEYYTWYWCCLIFIFGLADSSKACTHIINSSVQDIYSPGYPDVQTGLVSCSWQIVGDDHHVLLFVIKDLYIPTSAPNDCKDNYIHFTAPSKYYCGSNYQPLVYSSNSSTLYLKYYNTGIPRPGRGFRMTVFKVPKFAKHCPPGYFFCTNDNYCIPETLKDNGVPECSDAEDETILTTTLKVPENKRSSARSTPNTTVQQTESFISCSETFTSLFGSFNTPNYPHYYPHSADCEWLIEVKKGQNLQLHFMEFHLGSKDTVTVFDGLKNEKNIIGEYRANVRPDDLIQSSGHRLYIQFESQSIKAGNGFMATYMVKGFCDGDGWFSCGHDEDLCFYKNLRCDGIWHCTKHGGDERNCGKCAPDKFECSPGSSQCYSEADRCNGQGHCVKNDDELKCSSDKCGERNGTFLCQNRRCIIESWTCDGANDCGDNSDEIHCSSVASRKVITAAVVGAILCALLLVIALGCTCRLHAMRMREIMGHNYVSPVSRVQQEILARRSAPPLYDEAMQTSRPYDEMLAVMQQNLCVRNNISAAQNVVDTDDELLTDLLPSRISSADTNILGSNGELLNLHSSEISSAREDESGIGASNVELTLSAGAMAQWRRTAANTEGKVRKSPKPTNSKNTSNKVEILKSDDSQEIHNCDDDVSVEEIVHQLTSDVITSVTCDTTKSADDCEESWSLNPSAENSCTQPLLCLTHQPQQGNTDLITTNTTPNCDVQTRSENQELSHSIVATGLQSSENIGLSTMETEELYQDTVPLL